MSTPSTPRGARSARPPIEVEVRLLDWAPRGAIHADLDGRAILVDRGIPGETVVASVDRRRKPWHGVVKAISVASPHRISPICPYFVHGCGGCQLQHVEYEWQIKTKEMLVNRALAGADVNAVVARAWGMDIPWRYRHTAALALGWEAGFRPRGRRGIVEIHDCPISHPLIGQLAHHMNVMLRSGEVPNYHGKVWLDCTVSGSPEFPTVQVVIQGIQGLTPESNPELQRVAAAIARFGDIDSVAYRHRTGAVYPLIGESMSTIEVGTRSMYLPSGSFFQTNLEMLSILLRRIRLEIGDRHVSRAADIYGGVGTLGLAVADLVDWMILVELDGAALEAARRTSESWGLSHIRYVNLHAERALAHFPGLHLAVVDPPRSGLGDGVIDALVEAQVPVVLYVSCAPGSLARDIAAFKLHGYRLTLLEIFDFYPHTYHVESLAIVEL